MPHHLPTLTKHLQAYLLALVGLWAWVAWTGAGPISAVSQAPVAWQWAMPLSWLVDVAVVFKVLPKLARRQDDGMFFRVAMAWAVWVLVRSVFRAYALPLPLHGMVAPVVAVATWGRIAKVKWALGCRWWRPCSCCWARFTSPSTPPCRQSRRCAA